MDEVRRKKIVAYVQLLSMLRDGIQAFKDEEQRCLDSMPYNIQSDEIGEISKMSISSLEQALDVIDTATDDMNGALWQQTNKT
nr:MAG TPA: hypothetical protein [Caudoviricetes sp.]